MTDSGWHRVDIWQTFGIYMEFRIGLAADMDFKVCMESFLYTGELASGSVSEANPQVPVTIGVKGIISGSLIINVKPTQGTVTLGGEIEIVGHSAEPFTNLYLFSFDPTVGIIDLHPVAYPPAVPAQPWGSSGPSSDGILRINVDDVSRIGTDIGSKVRGWMFPEPQYHPFTFNVVPCCSTPKPGSGVGDYVNPGSIWFNVFYGIYDIYCNVSDGWKRPFGYQNDAGVGSKLALEDLERLGKADWNWFSNYLYGVPEDVCQQYSGIGEATLDGLQALTIGSSQWHQISMSNITVASAYQSDAPGAARLVENSMMTDEWRRSFGLPMSVPGQTVSFIPTTLRSTLFMAYHRMDEPNGSFFSTLMFGGTCMDDGRPENADFLAAQVAAVQQTIATHYPNSGFTG